MVVEVSKSFTHNCGKTPERPFTEKELKDMLVQLMQRNGINEKQIRLNKDGVLQVDDKANLKLHSIMLQAEEMGLTMKFTKKTVIEIC